MPIKVLVKQTPAYKVSVRVKRAQWQKFLIY
ncbi:MAG: hypothetical protein JWO96_427 [Candidatus Saccharibacteria bacterium]|nr:hypothetical protein [Candidatus Saccharibacteria bacterium]